MNSITNTERNIKQGLLLASFVAFFTLASFASTYAYGGNGGGYGAGCRGDATCRAERQAQMGAGQYAKNSNSHTHGMWGTKQGRQSGGATGAGAGHHGNNEARMAEIDKIKNSPLLPLSEKDKDTLVYMREEEKLARDVYLSLYDKWGENIFSNISKSEQRHMDMVKVLLDKYNLNDPIVNDIRGEFTDETLQNLYNDLIAQGNKSPLDALKVGATIEDVDIYDLENAMAETENADIINIYTKLRNASENHMRAFYKQIQANGSDYEAQYITDDRLEEILSAENRNHAMGGAQGARGYGHANGTQNTAGPVAEYGAQKTQMSFIEKILSWFKFWTW